MRLSQEVDAAAAENNKISERALKGISKHLKKERKLQTMENYPRKR
jgi:hypothetical protein